MEDIQSTIELKGKLQMLELKVQAIADLLEKEGIIIPEEIDNRLKELISKDDE